MAKRKPKLKKLFVWEPFEKVGITPEEIAYQNRVIGGDTPTVLKLGEAWVNNLYQVLVRRIPATDEEGNPNEGVADLVHISIRSHDREAKRDWRHFQRIKNELLGPEYEAVEMYPAESRLVDTSNQYHLWAIDDPTFRFPFGYQDRLVTEGNKGRARQRPFQRGFKPADCQRLDEI